MTQDQLAIKIIELAIQAGESGHTAAASTLRIMAGICVLGDESLERLATVTNDFSRDEFQSFVLKAMTGARK